MQIFMFVSVSVSIIMQSVTQEVKGLTKIQTVHTPRKKYVYMQIFMFVGFVVIEIRLFNRKNRKKKKKKKKKKMKNMATL